MPPLRAHLGLVAALVVAAVNVLWGIASLSLFGDEVFSIDVAREPLADPLFDRLRATEIAPPVYYVLLHGWIEATGAVRDMALRLPSAAAGVALVAVTYRLAALVGGPRAARVAAVLVALSPLVLTYGQQVRAYAPVMLLVTGAAVAAVTSARGGPRARALGWTSTVLCVAAVWTHYTALPVVAAIVAWSLLAAPGPGRDRIARPAVVGLATLLVLPLARAQFDRGSEDHAGAGLSGRTALEVLGTPFDGRDIAPIGLVAAGAIVVAFAVVAAVREMRFGLAPRDERVGGWADPRVLLLACGVGPVVVFLLLGLGGADVVWSRYTAVAAPFLVVLVALLADAPQRTLHGVVLAAVVLAAVGSIRVHGREGTFPATAEVVEAVDEGWREGDVLVLTLNGTVNASLQHYARRDLPAGASLAAPAPETFERARGRLWVVTPEIDRAALASYLPEGSTVEGTQVFDAAAPLQLTLVRP